MEEQKMGVFKELIKASISVDSYKSFVKNKTGKVVRFSFLLGFIFFLCTILIPLLGLNFSVGGLKGIVNQIPYFEFNGSYLYVAEPFILDTGDYTYINIDTSNNFSIDDLNSYYEGCLIDSEKIIVKTNSKLQVIQLNSLGENLNFTKDDLIKFIPYVYMYASVILLIVYIVQMIALFIGMFVLSLFALIINAFIRADVSYGKLFILSVYARTLPIFIIIILDFLNLSLPLNVSFAISVVYVILALKAIKKPEDKVDVLDYPEASQ